MLDRGLVAFIGSAATIVVGYRDLVTSNAAGRQGGVVAVDCPQCGATNRKARGMPLQHCAYCGASLVASAPVVHHAIEESKLDRMGEMMRRLRVTRSTTDSDSYNRGFYSALIFPGSIFLMFGLVIFGGGTINGERPHPILAPAVYTAALAIVLLPLVRFELRIQALRRGLTELSRSVFRGQPFHHPRFFAAWLNRHWCADQPSLSRSSVGLYGGVGGEVDGYPVAVELASGRLSVLVAAYLPDADPVHPHIDASWRQAGFGASWYATGLWLSSTSPHWKRDPGQVGELASIVRRAVEQVQRRGGRPLHFP